MTALERILSRNVAMATIRNCVACPLRLTCTQPVPFQGKTPARLLMIGESPDVLEDRSNKLWVGRMPRWMDEQMTACDLPPIEEWVVTNAVNCAPPEQRAPTAKEVFQCSRHLRAVIQVTDPSFILTLGAVALSAVGVRGALGEFHGRPFEVPAGPFSGRVVMPTFDPRVTLRDDRKVTDLINDLSTFSRLIHGTLDVASVGARVGRSGRLFLPE